MIFITGDIHGYNDIHKLTSDCFLWEKEITRGDYLIICGDFGLCWDHSNEEKYWLNWLDRKPWTTLWIDGNHENFELLSEYPVEEWNGAKVQKITDNIIHICRGSVFTIDSISFFAFGGAESHDKEYRILGKTIWYEELPSETEIETGREALEKSGWKADIIITHSFPTKIQEEVYQKGMYAVNELTDFFDEVNEKCSFRLWFSGHYHRSSEYDNKHFFIFNNIVRLTENGFVRVYPAADNTAHQETLPDEIICCND